MEFLKKLVAQSKTHLGSLTISQRAAIGLCVIIIIGALAWLMQWSAKPELTPLVNQDLTAEELGRIQSRLSDAGAQYQVSGSRILVKPDERALWLARLGEQQALPSDLTITFESLMKDQSPFINMDEQAWRRQVATSGELSKIVRQFSGVADARVLVDKTEKRGVGRAPTVPTASVSIKMRAGQELDRAKVHAIASLVASSVAGMNVKNVTVVDASTGVAFSVSDPSEPGSFDDLDDRRRKEQYFRDKLAAQFGYIPGIHIGIHAELDPDAKKTETTKFGKPVKISEETESTSQERGGGGTPPGVVPNTARSVAGGSSAEKMEKSRGKEDFQAGVDKTVEISERMRHGLKNLHASINIPHSYYVNVFKSTNPGKEPTGADLDPLIRLETEKVQKQAMNLIAASDKSFVQVDTYYDTMPTELAEAETATGEMIGWVKAYGGQAGLMALAIVSLLMMLMLVRRSSEGPVLPGEEPPKPIIFVGRRGSGRGGAKEKDVEEIPEEVWASAAPIGEAQATSGMLEGREVTEEEIRAQQVIEQVTQLVTDDPETAASLVHGWIEADE